MSISNRMYDRLNKLYHLVVVRMRKMEAVRAFPRPRLRAAAALHSYQRHGLEQLEPRTLLSASPYEQTTHLTSLAMVQDYTPAIYVSNTPATGPAVIPQDGPDTAQASPVPGIPALSSRPGAAYTIYLNFGGFSFSGVWGVPSLNYNPGSTPAYDSDGNPTSFSATELANIKNIWSRVAEKFSVFDINVTTVDPAATAGQAGTDQDRQTYYDSQAQMMHTVIGGSGAWLGKPAGGVSYVNKTPYAQPNLNGGHTNWIFSAGAPTNLLFVADGAAHENGHGLGLYHQGNYSGDTLESEYSSGTAQVAPIMGNAFALNSQRGLWSLGTANNNDGSGPPIMQNDVWVLANNLNMGGFVDDGIGHFMAAATPIPLQLDEVDFISAKGIIHPGSVSNPAPLGAENYTPDWWVFATNGGEITLSSVSGRSTINPGFADPGATLHTALSIFDSAGNMITDLKTSSLSQTYTGILDAGTYYARILPVVDVVDNNPNYTSRSFFDMGSYFLTGSGLTQVIVDPSSGYDFDFGTATSPLLSNTTRITETTYYSSALGYGWQSGVIDSRDRGTSAGTNAQSQDLNFTTDGTFAVDVANGSYNVSVQLGDTANYLHDQMGVYLEGVLQESVNTAKGQVVTKTYTVNVADGQLNLRLKDLGGIDANVTIQGLSIISTGPQVNHAPTVVDLNKTLTQGTTMAFTANDFAAAFSDQDQGNTLQKIKITTLPSNGTVRLNGSTVTAGQEIEINQLATLTYTPDSGYTGSDSFQWTGSDGQLYATSNASVNLTVNPATSSSHNFDFGTASSPLLAGTTRVTETTGYNANLGYGWQNGVIGSRDRGASAGTNGQTQDLNFTTDGTFAVDVANGSYEVTVYLGDKADYLHDQMGIYFENIFKESVSTAKGQVVAKTYTVNVTDGQLNLRLKDLGGVDANVTIAGLKIISSGPPVNHAPTVVDIRKTLNLDTTLTFTANDFAAAFSDQDSGDTLQIIKITALPSNGVVKLNGSAVTLNQEIILSQLANLTYTPNSGYSGSDSFQWTGSDGQLYATNSASVNLTVNPASPSSYEFDFGTATSPLLAGTTRVTATTTYNANLGYGWQSGVIDSRDRGVSSGSTAQTQDLNFTTDGTFAVDVANGSYEVTIYLGDKADYLHDQMGIYFENIFKESVSTAKGQVVAKTYTVNVTDGQLNLRLKDLGGIDANVTIQGLKIIAIP